MSVKKWKTATWDDAEHGIQYGLKRGKEFAMTAGPKGPERLTFDLRSDAKAWADRKNAASTAPSS